MSAPLRIVVTGASGFVGRLLVTLLRRHHHVVAVDRRALSASEMADHPNVEWYQVDLCDREAVEGTMACIAAGGGAQVLLHLAAYYDYSGEEHPEYQRTNVDALRILLDAARRLSLEHFVFVSSVAACPFSRPGHPITEATPPDGGHIYARTKAAGERMLTEYTGPASRRSSSASPRCSRTGASTRRCRCCSTPGCRDDGTPASSPAAARPPSPTCTSATPPSS